MNSNPQNTLPPALVPAPNGAVVRYPDSGEIHSLSSNNAMRLLAQQPLLFHNKSLLHQYFGRRLTIHQNAFDLAELFFFIHPQLGNPPFTIEGLLQKLSIPIPQSPEGLCSLLPRAVYALLKHSSPAETPPHAEQTRRELIALHDAQWPWAPSLLLAQNLTPNNPLPPAPWDALPKRREKHVPQPDPDVAPIPVSPDEAVKTLRNALQIRDQHEIRPQQEAYARAAANAFANNKETHIALLEGETGSGKTLAYLSAAVPWALKNNSSVWISTYTRNLQEQLLAEARNAFPDVAHVVAARKSDKNYLCLRNLELALSHTALSHTGAAHAQTNAPQIRRSAVFAARWVRFSRDGAVQHGDFPHTIASPDDIAARVGVPLNDRAGDCTGRRCPHFQKCLPELAKHKAKHARIVVTNHSFLLLSSSGDSPPPSRRLILDEGHRLFDAADDAFKINCSAAETYFLRRLVLGNNPKARRNGALREALSSHMQHAPVADALLALETAADNLPHSPGWLKRIRNNSPVGVAETFFQNLRSYVLSHNQGNPYYSLDVAPPSCSNNNHPYPHADADAFNNSASIFADVLKSLHSAFASLLKRLADVPNPPSAAFMRTLNDKALSCSAWHDMLNNLSSNSFNHDDHIHIMRVERRGARETDYAFLKHDADPTVALHDNIYSRIDGVVITSATLRDSSRLPLNQPDDPNPDEHDDPWQYAQRRTGAQHPQTTELFTSPFLHHSLSRFFIVNDLPYTEPPDIADAMIALFLASNGGALGVFNNLQRLKLVHKTLAPALSSHGIPLFSHHASHSDADLLVRVFRENPNSCLLGSHAVRDGVDAPGPTLRLVVMERAPWPQPNLLHLKRRNAFGGRSAYDHKIARQAIRQAYGRLIRKQDDRGVFVILGKLPTPLRYALPNGVDPISLPLRQAADKTREFLSD